MKGKMKNIMELPNECLLEIMSYLSTYDILRNMAGVSKRFHKLSQNPLLIRKIEVNSGSWPKNQEKKYLQDLLEVLKRSLRLTFLSFDFGIAELPNSLQASSAETFLKSLPSMDHEFLKEFCLKAAYANDFLLNEEYEDLNKYLEKQPNLKILRFEIKPPQNVHEVGEEVEVEDEDEVIYPG